jgi:hypothetical protein
MLLNLIFLSTWNIENAISSVKNIIYNGYIFRRKCNSPWELTTFKPKYNKPRKISITDMVTKEVIVIDSLRKACKKLTIDKRTLKNRLVTGKPYKNFLIEEV